MSNATENIKIENARRAARGKFALDAYLGAYLCNEVVDADSAMRDLLADLMHLADQRSDMPSFERELEVAKMNYRAEVSGNGD